VRNANNPEFRIIPEWFDNLLGVVARVASRGKQPTFNGVHAVLKLNKFIKVII